MILFLKLKNLKVLNFKKFQNFLLTLQEKLELKKVVLNAATLIILFKIFFKLNFKKLKKMIRVLF